MKESDFNSREEYVRARLTFLRKKLEDLGEILHFSDENTDPEEELAFLEHIYVLESQPTITHAHQLIEHGVSLPPPDDLDDQQLHAKLWEIIHALEELRVFLENTNHLSDRRLYERLWTDTLNEFTWDMSHSCNGALHIDMCGSGSEEDTRDWLRFYADDIDRQQWAEDFPEEPIPPKVPPPTNRDSQLPTAGWGEECGWQDDNDCPPDDGFPF